MVLRTAAVLFIALLAGVASGCGVDAPVSASVPNGGWVCQAIDTDAGTMLRSHIRLDAYRGNYQIDSFFRSSPGGWMVDSTRSVVLELSAVGDGYQRVLEISSAGSSESDTTLRYWYFYRHGDTLRYYRGMRFEGASPLLLGSWTMSESDRPLCDPFDSYEFSTDSVVVRRQSVGSEPTIGHFGYSATRDSLRIEGLPSRWGNRYEIFAASALYLTSFATRAYLPE